MVVGEGVDGKGIMVQFLVDEGDFSPLQSFQTGYGTLPVFCVLRARGLSSRSKVTRA